MSGGRAAAAAATRSPGGAARARVPSGDEVRGLGPPVHTRAGYPGGRGAGRRGPAESRAPGARGSRRGAGPRGLVRPSRRPRGARGRGPGTRVLRPAARAGTEPGKDEGGFSFFFVLFLSLSTSLKTSARRPPGASVSFRPTPARLPPPSTEGRPDPLLSFSFLNPLYFR